jgi:starch synthase (maltosyl-transferring)
MADRPRICFLITELDQGGAERALVRIATGLPRAEWDVTVICLGPEGPLAAPLREAGIPVDCLGVTSICSPRSLWRATFGLARLLKQIRPALLQTFLFHAGLAGRIAARPARVPMVVCGLRVAERRSRWRLRLDRWTDWLVDRHVCVSQAVADFSQRESRLPAGKLVVIPNGVDFDRFHEAEPADLSRFGIPDGAKVLLTVGRLDPQKAPLELVRIFAELAADHPEWHLLLVGDGLLRTELRQLIDAGGLGVRVHLAGWQADVPEIMRACDLFVLNSRWEGMPNVVLEAAAAGLPVIATRCEGVAEIIESGVSGVLVEVNQPQAMRAALESAMTRQNDATARVSRLQQIVSEQFTWQSVISRYAALYRELLAALH